MASNQSFDEETHQPISNGGYANPFLSDAIKKLYLDATTADVHFIFNGIEHSERIPAHKNILAAHCEAFKAMFYGDLSENGDIPVVDASAAAFKEFLQFFYLDKINLTMTNIYDVVNLSKKYVFAPCLSICECFLMDSLSIENVCVAYELAILFDLSDLKQTSEEMVQKNAETVFTSNGFLECDRSLLGYILALDNVQCTETTVFNSCMKWVRAVNGQAKVTRQMINNQLGDLFYELPFGTMTIEQFTSLLPSYGHLFTADEYQELVQMIVAKNFQPKIFKGKSNQIKEYRWSKDAVIRCCRVFEEFIASWFYFQDIETTTFSTNRPILLGEIVCAPINMDGVFPSEIVIFELNPAENPSIPKMIHFQKITTTKSVLSQTIALDEMLLIKPNFNYEIQFKQCHVNCQFYAKPLRAATILSDIDVIIIFSTVHQRQSSLIRALNFNLIIN